MVISSETWAAVIGAIVGSLIGGSIAAWISHRQLRYTTRERNQGLAYGLLVKIALIASHLSSLNHHFEKILGKLPKGESPSSVLGPLSANWRHIEFSTDELALLVSLREDSITNSVMMIDEHHNHTLDQFSFYSERRIRLTDSIEPFDVTGNQFSLPVSPETQLRIGELDSLLDAIQQNLSSDSGRALKVLQEAADLFKRKLGVGFTALPKVRDTDL